MIFYQRLSIRQIKQTIDVGQAAIYTLGVEDWAIGTLKDYLLNKNGNKAYTTNWPIIMPSTKIDNGIITGKIWDLQARFNINNLHFKNNNFNLHEFIKASDPSITDNIAKTIANEINSWFDKIDNSPNTTSANLSNPPYQIPNQIMMTQSELLLINGINNKLYTSLIPHIIAIPIPKETAININTAPLNVLMTLGDGLSIEQAKEIIKLRKDQNGFNKITDFMSSPLFKKTNIKQTEICLLSDYYLVLGNTNFGKYQFTLYSLIEIKHWVGKIKASILWRSRGIL